MATTNMKDIQMNNWPNPDALGEPKFPDIARPHFLSYADKSVYNDLDNSIKQDALLVALWSPHHRKWLFMTGDMLTTTQIVAECDYISPCYTEEEMRQAKRDIIEDAITDCEFVGDQALDDAESHGAYACAEYIRKWQKDI